MKNALCFETFECFITITGLKPVRNRSSFQLKLFNAKNFPSINQYQYNQYIKKTLISRKKITKKISH